MTTVTFLWKDQFKIEKTKYVKALNGNYIIFSREGLNPNDTSVRGLYYSKIDFNILEDNKDAKLTEIIKLNVKPIMEFSSNTRLLSNWEAKGNDHIIAVAFSVDTSGEPEHNSLTYTTRLMALTRNAEKFNVCDTFDHTDQLISIEVIIPFEDKERAHAIYGSNGLYYSKH